MEFPRKNPETPNDPWAHDARVSLHPQSGLHVFTGTLSPKTCSVYMYAWSSSSNTGSDGVAYEFDVDKNAWFPMFDESLVNSQQSIYSVPGVNEHEIVRPKKRSKKDVDDKNGLPTAKKANTDKKPKANRSVYVTGLPPDATTNELKDIFSKYGLLMEDMETGESKIKIYKDNSGKPKGDALVTYFKPESVQLCVSLLDDTEFRFGQTERIRVQEAVFQDKETPAGSESKSNSNAKKVDKKKLEKARQKLEKRLEWFEEDDETKMAKYGRFVILKHMFTLEELKEDPTLLLDLKQDVWEECEKLGIVTNVVLYDLEPEGVMVVRFKDLEAAELCVRKMHGRFFGGRQITAQQMDKKEKFQQSPNHVTEEEEKERLESYEAWLESQH